MRAAIVGAGLMGRWHAQALRRLRQPLAGVVDVDPSAAEQLARGGTRAFADLEACLAGGDVRVVHVCTPLATHADLVRTALAAGCHVLVEKPLATSLAETRLLLDDAAAAGLLLSPVHQFPFQPGFRRLVAARGGLGELVRVSYRTCSAGGEGRTAAARRAILKEILPHPVSLLRRLLPELDVDELNLQTFDDDDLVLVGEHRRVQLEVVVSLRGRPTRNELEVIGTQGSARADLFGGYAVLEGGRVSRLTKIGRPFTLGTGLIAHAGVNLGARALRREPAYPGLRELIRQFHAAAAGRGDAPVPPAEALASAALVDTVAG